MKPEINPSENQETQPNHPKLQQACKKQPRNSPGSQKSRTPTSRHLRIPNFSSKPTQPPTAQPQLHQTEAEAYPSCTHVQLNKLQTGFNQDPPTLPRDSCSRESRILRAEMPYLSNLGNEVFRSFNLPGWIILDRV